MRTHCYNTNCPNHHTECSDLHCPKLINDGYFCSFNCKTEYWNEGENAEPVTERSQAKEWIRRNFDVMSAEKRAESLKRYFKTYIIDEKRTWNQKKRQVEAIFNEK